MNFQLFASWNHLGYIKNKLVGLPAAPKTISFLLHVEIFCISVATVCSVIAGAAGPANAIAFAQILTVYTTLDSDEQEFQTIMWSLMFLIIGVVSFLAVTGEVIINKSASFLVVYFIMFI